MKVKVVKANLPTYWYARKVGKVFTVRKSGIGYVVTDPIPEDAGYYIDIDDAVEVKKEEPKKVCNFKVDLSWVKGQAREVISEAIQKKLFEAGCKWHEGQISPILKDRPYLRIYTNLIECRLDKEEFDNWKCPEVSVNNALKGNFWTYSSIPKKEEPKPEGYKVSLAAYTGKAREAISKAIQEAAFKKGYGWGVFSRDKIIQNTDAQYLFFEIEDKCIMTCTDTNDAFYKLDGDKELSVEEILSGALPKVN